MPRRWRISREEPSAAAGGLRMSDAASVGARYILERAEFPRLLGALRGAG